MGFVSPPIGEALASSLSDDLGGALGIFDAQARAVVIAEIELSEIAMQMSFAAMLVHALHAALEDREEAFDGVGMDFAANVFA